MSNMFKKSKFTNIGNILPTVLEKLGLDRRLNETALFSLWTSLVDEIYVNRSIPLYIDASNILLVAVEDSSTAQEMSFFKPKLLEKLKRVAPQLGLRIDGLRFDLKQFYAAKQERIDSAANKNISKDKIGLSIKERELEAIILTEEEVNEISNLKAALHGIASHPEQSNIEPAGLFTKRIVDLVERRLRLNKWHKSKNLPFCKQCGEPVFESAAILCHYCIQLKQT